MARQSSYYGPIKARKKPVEVEAFQFTGWNTAELLMQWASDIYFVGRGYEHSLRREHEHDRGNHHILEDAPEFLVVKTVDGPLRVDKCDWVIKDSNGEYSYMAQGDFDVAFDKIEEPVSLVKDSGGH